MEGDGAAAAQAGGADGRASIPSSSRNFHRLFSAPSAAGVGDAQAAVQHASAGCKGGIARDRRLGRLMGAGREADLGPVGAGTAALLSAAVGGLLLLMAVLPALHLEPASDAGPGSSSPIITSLRIGVITGLSASHCSRGVIGSCSCWGRFAFAAPPESGRTTSRFAASQTPTRTALARLSASAAASSRSAASCCCFCFRCWLVLWRGARGGQNG